MGGRVEKFDRGLGRCAVGGNVAAGLALLARATVRQAANVPLGIDFTG